MNFRYKLMEFMRGRYGLDNMFYVLFAVAAALAFLNCFIRSFVLQMIVYAIGIYAFYRVLSRNVEARARENRKVNEILRKLKNKRKGERIGVCECFIVDYENYILYFCCVGFVFCAEHYSIDLSGCGNYAPQENESRRQSLFEAGGSSFPFAVFHCRELCVKPKQHHRKKCGLRHLFFR